MEKIYRDDFNFVESSKNGDLIKISEINKMIEYGAVSINREKLEDYKKTTRERKVSYDEWHDREKQRNKRLYEVIQEILMDNGYQDIGWNKNLQIVCKTDKGKLIGLIYTNHLTNNECRLFQFIYSDSEDPMTHDYDSLLRYVEYINKPEDWWCTKYIYFMEEIYERIERYSKYYSTTEIITDYPLLDKILNGVVRRREYILG